MEGEVQNFVSVLNRTRLVQNFVSVLNRSLLGGGGDFALSLFFLQISQADKQIVTQSRTPGRGHGAMALLEIKIFVFENISP